MPVPDPEVVIPPGFRVSVQLPEEGNPPRITLPVARMHDGCVMVPTVGTEGKVGWALMTTFAEAAELHPVASATVKV